MYIYIYKYVYSNYQEPNHDSPSRQWLSSSTILMVDPNSGSFLYLLLSFWYILLYSVIVIVIVVDVVIVIVILAISITIIITNPIITIIVAMYWLLDYNILYSHYIKLLYLSLEYRSIIITILSIATTIAIYLPTNMIVVRIVVITTSTIIINIIINMIISMNE